MDEVGEVEELGPEGGAVGDGEGEEVAEGLGGVLVEAFIETLRYDNTERRGPKIGGWV